ncbi:partial Inner membrane ABC transporter permease protein YcjO, partial [Anaerolineae bacterium]
ASFTNASLLRPLAGDWVGLDNYVDILSSSRFYQMLQVTLVYTAGSVIGTLLIALLAALFMNRPFVGIGLARALITIPWAAPDVAIVLIFVWMFNNQYGVFNYLLTQVGILETYQRWLDNPAVALPVVIGVTIWKIFPFSALVLLAALQSIPDELYEAARVDGADQLNVFKNVMLPWISPTLAVVTLLITIWSLRRFSIVWLLTQGGPVLTTNTLVIDVYRESFKSLHIGYGAAIGVIGLCISMIATGVYFVVTQRTVETEGGTR